MFDFSFTELMVVGAVALIVIGPEKLPKVARTIGHLVGRMQRYVTDVKSDINREMEFEELRRLRKEMNEAASAVESSARQHASDIRTGLDDVAKTADVTADEAAASPAAKADAGLSAPANGASIASAATGADSTAQVPPAPTVVRPSSHDAAAGVPAAGDAAAVPAPDSATSKNSPNPS